MSALKVVFIVLCTIAGLGALAFVGCAGCLGSLAAIGANAHNNANTQSASVADSTSTAGAAPPITISAFRLYADYHANEVAADQRYKGQHLVVTGYVESINKSVFDTIVVNLAANEFDTVMANIRKDEENQAAVLSKGMPLTVDCTGGGMTIGSPSLRDCSIVEQKPQPETPSAYTPVVAPIAPAIETQSSVTETPPTTQQPTHEQVAATDKSFVGKTEDDIRAAFGAPTSLTISGNRKLMNYPHGIVTLENGSVVAIERF
jgi:hypothetical protein